jgi:hypothetical protein
MTHPRTNAPASTATTSTLVVPGSAAPEIARLDVPGTLYSVRPGDGSEHAVVCDLDFAQADVVANAIAPTWSSPDLVISEYGLDTTRAAAEKLLHAVFGNDAKLVPLLERNEETRAPELIFRLDVPRTLRNRRDTFLDRYVREVVLPAGAPVPVLLWAYQDAVPA